MFEHIKAAPADPILGLGEAFKSETRENKINLGIGVYKDAQGTTPIMRAVKEAEKRLFDNEKTKNYLTIDGIADYNERTKELLFGKDSDVIKANRARTAQSLGGWKQSDGWNGLLRFCVSCIQPFWCFTSKKFLCTPVERTGSQL